MGLRYAKRPVIFTRQRIFCHAVREKKRSKNRHPIIHSSCLDHEWWLNPNEIDLHLHWQSSSFAALVASYFEHYDRAISPRLTTIELFTLTGHYEVILSIVLWRINVKTFCKAAPITRAMSYYLSNRKKSCTKFSSRTLCRKRLITTLHYPEVLISRRRNDEWLFVKWGWEWSPKSLFVLHATKNVFRFDFAPQLIHDSTLHRARSWILRLTWTDS